MIKPCKTRFQLHLLLYMVCLLPLSSGQAQQSSMLLPQYPDTYVVQQDDTLWTIASQFLNDPARWEEIWQPDPYLDNADRIYPGDELSINFVGGSPRVMVKRGGREVQSLAPQVRSEPLSSSIPAIPLESIENSFTRNRIISQELYDAAPYIVQNLGDNLAIGTGDEVFARGEWPQGTTLFEVYRPSREYFDEEDDDILLGLEVEYLGFASIVETPREDLRRLVINNSSKEIRVGDRLLVREQSRIGATIYPTEPDNEVEGRIISLQNNEAMASQLDTVVVNLGTDDSLKIGDVLAVREEDDRIVDRVERERMGFRERMRAIFSGQRLNLPGDDVGTLLVYRTFEQFSYAVILSSLRPIELDNRVTDP